MGGAGTLHSLTLCCTPQTLFKKMAVEKPHNSRMSVDSGHFVFHYIINADVCYLTLTEKSYPRKLAYQYLEELQTEFINLYGPQIQSVSRPYAFIKFGERLHPATLLWVRCSVHSPSGGRREAVD